ncbi:unnamed protein product [Nippostrongylus brasiliensis]|uniref:CRAL-TRIO domain-containing protein n=1 Tax=Nippostrongylus brasiliensis TaxID=27835 RepID=A0A0N4YZF5_NIPBR|nr:unnamed protein product [Nippostrongylus brasiliensis]
MWPIENKVPLSTTGLMDIIKMARSWRRRAPDRPESKPTIVMSHNGVSRVGVYIGANICIDQMDTDHEVDVFHAVKMMRINRPQLIDMKPGIVFGNCVSSLCLFICLRQPAFVGRTGDLIRRQSIRYLPVTQ